MRLALCVLVMVTIGCSNFRTVHKPGSGGGPREMPGAGTKQQDGTPVGLGSKAVHGKEEPATLVAQDGSRCIVTEKRFRETAIGEIVWCAWR